MIAGLGVKVLAVVAVPSEFVTVILGGGRPEGTVAVIWVEEFMTNVAGARLNATAVAALKLVPLTVTATPTTPRDGDIEVIVGGTANEALVPVPTKFVP